MYESRSIRLMRSLWISVNDCLSSPAAKRIASKASYKVGKHA